MSEEIKKNIEVQENEEQVTDLKDEELDHVAGGLNYIPAK